MKYTLMVAALAGALAMTACAPSHKSSESNDVKVADVDTKLTDAELLEKNLQDGPWWSACNEPGIFSWLTSRSQRTKLWFSSEAAYMSTVSYDNDNCEGEPTGYLNTLMLNYKISDYGPHAIPYIAFEQFEYKNNSHVIFKSRIKDSGQYFVRVKGDTLSFSSNEGHNMFEKKDSFTREVTADPVAQVPMGTERF